MRTPDCQCLQAQYALLCGGGMLEYHTLVKSKMVEDQTHPAWSHKTVKLPKRLDVAQSLFCRLTGDQNHNAAKDNDKKQLGNYSNCIY